MALGAAAVAVVGVTGAFGTITGAQSETDPIQFEAVSVDGSDARLALADNATAVVSHSGAVVAFEALDADADVDADSGVEPGTRVWVRDRVGSTSAIAEVGSTAPGISGDGCQVAYTVPGADGTLSFKVVDRCDSEADAQLSDGTLLLPMGTLVDMVTPDALEPEAAVRPAPPALSLDGSTIVWSTGGEILRYSRSSADDDYSKTPAFDVAAPATPATVTGPSVDVSDDGGTVVFVAGVGSTPFEPTPANVYVWTPATAETGPELLSSTTADTTDTTGTTADTTGATGASDSTSPTVSSDGSFVVFASTNVDLDAVGAAPLTTPFVVGVDLEKRTTWVLVDDATDPTLSADGNHVAYRRGDAIRVLSDTNAVPAERRADELAGVAPTGPIAISQYGRWIVFGSSVALLPAEPSITAPTIWAADLNASDPTPFDSTTAPTTSTPTTSSTTNPTTTTAPAVETSSTTTDVAISATVPATTLVPSGVVERFGGTTFPRFVFPNAPRPPVRVPPSYNGYDDSTGYNGSTGSPVTFNSLPFASQVVFEPTVVDAGRRTQQLMLTNASADTATVMSVVVEPAGPFGIVADGCSGISIEPGGSCVVDVQFAPVEPGPANGFVTFQLADGSVVTASVDGEGSMAPTLDLVPAVAGAGQTVTVFGAGFPPGSVVEFTQPGAATPEPLTVDADGTFAHVIVVLPNTPTGPVVLGVPGQIDIFGDITAELLVSGRSARSSDAAVRGRLGSSIAN